MMRSKGELERAIRDETCPSRRAFLAYGAAMSSIALGQRSSRAEDRPRLPDNPFTLGVASGDPNSHSVVLWTRLAPRPLEPAGGMPPVPIRVQWQVAEDDAMRQVVASGSILATPQLGHSVHIEPQGLRPDRWYWYRFRVGDAESPVGRTRTFPQPHVMPRRLNFAVTSCQNFEQGLFTAYEQMARDDIDLVFHLGDYIYEYEAGRNGKVRTHLGRELESLDDYRIRYAQYRSDPLLRGMHAVCPWMMTWDDHEFDNNCAGHVSEEEHVDPVDFMVRRANAYQAYYEMMPLRRSTLPRGPHMRLYRNTPFGRLAELMLLDTRQYRTDQPNGDRKSPLNEAALNRRNSLLGAQQRNWLFHSLIDSRATWNVLAQQVMMGTVGFRSNDEPLVYSMDQWPGYAAERARLLQFMSERKVPNPVVLTGDIHSNWANELRVDDRQPETPPVATEFVATSLSSGGNGVNVPAELDRLLADNPCIKFHNRERGYIHCSLTPDTWTSQYMVVDDVLQPGGRTFARASFVVEAGDPQVNPA